MPCPEATGLALFLRPQILFFSCQSCSVGLAGSEEERKLKEEEGRKQHLGFLQSLSGKPARSQAFGLFICKESYRAIELVLVAAESRAQQLPQLTPMRSGVPTVFAHGCLSGARRLEGHQFYC